VAATDRGIDQRVLRGLVAASTKFNGLSSAVYKRNSYFLLFLGVGQESLTPPETEKGREQYSGDMLEGIRG